MWRYRLQDRFGDVDLVPARWLETRDVPRTAIPTREDIQIWMVGDTDYYTIIDAIRACDEAIPNLWARNPEDVDVWVFRTLTRLFTARDLLVVDVVWPVPPPGIVKRKPIAEDMEPAPDAESWFKARVLDDIGNPLTDLAMMWSVGGMSSEAKTDGSGWVELRGKFGSTGSVRVLNLAQCKQLLRERFSKKPAKEWKSEDPKDARIEVLGSVAPTIKLESEKPFTLILARLGIRARLLGMHFETNKSLILPSAMKGIRGIVELFDSYPDSKLLVAGHTDTVGSEEANLALSLERAESVAAYLKDEVNNWLAWFDDDKPLKKRWGIREIQLMLSAIPAGDPCFVGSPTGREDDKHQEAVKKFQRVAVAGGKDLAIDGKAGPATRKEIVTAYMALAGTSLPKSADLVVHGCGENFPEEDAGDEVASAENRRVEVFYFDGKVAPAPAGKTSKKGGTEYPAWRKSVTREERFEHHLVSVRVVDDEGKGVPGARVATGASEALTDDDGVAHLPVEKAGSHPVTVYREGIKPPATGEGVDDVTGAPDKPIAATPRPDGAPVDVPTVPKRGEDGDEVPHPMALHGTDWKVVRAVAGKNGSRYKVGAVTEGVRLKVKTDEVKEDHPFALKAIVLDNQDVTENKGFAMRDRSRGWEGTLFAAMDDRSKHFPDRKRPYNAWDIKANVSEYSGDFPLAGWKLGIVPNTTDLHYEVSYFESNTVTHTAKFDVSAPCLDLPAGFAPPFIYEKQLDDTGTVDFLFSDNPSFKVPEKIKNEKRKAFLYRAELKGTFLIYLVAKNPKFYVGTHQPEWLTLWVYRYTIWREWGMLAVAGSTYPEVKHIPHSCAFDEGLPSELGVKLEPVLTGVTANALISAGWRPFPKGWVGDD